jgi:membrane dipeptidase
MARPVDPSDPPIPLLPRGDSPQPTDPPAPRGVSRRAVLKGVASTLLGACGASLLPEPLLAAPRFNRRRFALFPGGSDEYSERAIRLVQESTVLEMLHGMGQGSGTYLADPDRFPDEELAKYRESGIDVFHITTASGGIDPHATVLTSVARMNGFIARHHAHFRRITSGADLAGIGGSGRMGILVGFQNSEHFRTVEDVDLFHGLGQRISQLTYNAQNRLGTGAMDRTDQGLSDFGADVVERMNQVGMAVDVSHCGDRTTLDTFEVSTRPVLITHSNARALVPGYPRNKTDEAIRKMAETGGVMGLTSVRSFVRDREPTTLEHLLDHYDHVARLVGVEHVGIGSDHSWEGYDATPMPAWESIGGRYREQYAFRHKIDMDELTHPKRVYDLTEGLIARGYSDPDIALILGGNFARVLSEIWDAPTG